MPTLSPLIFFGNERLATAVTTTAPTLRALITAGYPIAAVVSHDEHSTSRKKRLLEIAEVAHAHNIPVLLPTKPADILEQLKSYRPAAAVLIAYGKIVPQNVIDVFPKGIINIHPSPLPEYRGPTPVEQAILDGRIQTAVSLMQLEKAMDAGPVYAQRDVPITPDISKQALATTLLETGAELLIQNLPSILDGRLQPTPQDESRATYCNLLNKRAGKLDPSTKTAAQLEREIRAYLGYPKSRLTFNDNEVIVTTAHVVDSATDQALVVNCADNTLLAIDQLIAPSGKSMDAASFIRGYSTR